MQMNPRPLHVSLILSGLVSMYVVAAHADQQALPAERECAITLDIANKELEQARVKGLAGSVAFVEASGLLVGAKVQQEFGKYPNCVDKAKRARFHIKRAAVDKEG